MKLTFKIASVLTWFNLIFWGVLDALLILSALSSMYTPFLVIAVLMSAIPLNCYAALKLQTSIRNPAVPLSSQTPAGIRFVGFIALFLGITSLVDGSVLIRNTQQILGVYKEQLSQVPQMAQSAMFKSLSVTDLRWLGVFILILGLSIVVNVVLNLRLLRWYILSLRKDGST